MNECFECVFNVMIAVPLNSEYCVGMLLQEKTPSHTHIHPDANEIIISSSIIV